MSDAGRKMDVEDVLSSIRRLVSEEARSAPEKIPPQTPPSTPVSETPEISLPAREKLVLTPAFRISEEPTLDTPLSNDTPDSLENEAPIALDIPEEPEIQAQTLAPLVAEETVKDAPPETAFTAVVEEQTEATDYPQTTPLDIAAIIPNLEDLQQQAAAHQQEPVPELQDSISTDPLAEMAPEVSVDPVFSPVEVPMEPPVTPEAEIAIEDVEKPAESLEAATENSANSSEYDAIDFTAEKETYLDEEALRELVSEMVRSELQGELGDRITRNVRKLVRREIHRALASREFD